MLFKLISKLESLPEDIQKGLVMTLLGPVIIYLAYLGAFFMFGGNVEPDKALDCAKLVALALCGGSVMIQHSLSGGLVALGYYGLLQLL